MNNFDLTELIANELTFLSKFNKIISNYKLKENEYFQYDPDQINKIKKEFVLLLTDVISDKAKHLIFEYNSEVRPFSSLNIIFDYEKINDFYYEIWKKLKCIDELGREFSDPSYIEQIKSNPSNLKNFQKIN